MKFNRVEESFALTLRETDASPGMFLPQEALEAENIDPWEQIEIDLGKGAVRILY